MSAKTITSGDICIKNISIYQQGDKIPPVQKQKKKAVVSKKPLAEQPTIKKEDETMPPPTQTIKKASRAARRRRALLRLEVKEPPTPVASEPSPTQVSDPVQLDTLTARILESELQDIMIKVWQQLPDKPTDVVNEVVVDKMRSSVGDTIRNMIGLNASKRLLNVFNPLCVKLEFSVLPEHDEMSNFTMKYNLKDIKRITQTPIQFAAYVTSINNFDKICSEKPLKCGLAKVTVTPDYKFDKCPKNLKSNYDEDNSNDNNNSDTKPEAKISPKKETLKVDNDKKKENKELSDITQASNNVKSEPAVQKIIETKIEKNPQAAIKKNPETTIEKRSESTVQEKPQIAIQKKTDGIIEKRLKSTIQEKPQIAIHKITETTMEKTAQAVIEQKHEATIQENHKVEVEIKYGASLQKKLQTELEKKPGAPIQQKPNTAIESPLVLRLKTPVKTVEKKQQIALQKGPAEIKKQSPELARKNVNTPIESKPTTKNLSQVSKAKSNINNEVISKTGFKDKKAGDKAKQSATLKKVLEEGDDFDELNDDDILALMSEGIIVDEC